MAVSVIDDLLKQDEAELREKKKRLRAFQGALDEARRAHAALSAAGAALLEAGDVSRAEASKVFKLTRPERAAAFPARSAQSGSGVSDAVDERAASTKDAEDDPHEGAQDQ
ncbi:hypothetical protein [Bifidobacterium mongoliense]|uniref:Transposase n=1 Tax=Bifidobacterium mongoliense TaxID=518643 RepID=A0A423UBZ7_9BIFI|nr:hypothetical protein [Bifidobacterium mongoliense]ROT86229.1 transposase [Bifidobacterium mongoliense]